MRRVDTTIIGGGPVGLFGAFYAGMRGMSVRIIDSLPELGGQLTALYPEKLVYDMPGFPAVPARQLADGLIEQASRFKPEVVLEETAAHLENEGEDGYSIVSASGNRYPTRTVVVSAGNGAFSPTKLGAAGEDEFVGRGVYYGVRSKAEFAGRRVVIVGGGDSAFDWALNLHDVARSITLVHRRDQFRAHEETVQAVRDLGVEFRLWRVVKEVHGNGRLHCLTLEDVQNKSDEKMECDAVVVNIGFKSSLGPLKDWGFKIERNQIVVDEKFNTGLPGVFAVGDVCSYANKIRLIATGVGEAATVVCLIKTMIDPAAKLFPGHSSDMEAVFETG
ncbi:MAG: NAD(P)/FAD-dependent oxidoreductase [Fimbriimonadaceae bacterium]|nr:NAD(P)/FAD-dependent oxidoreductase [Fimbriimonadaceae bacterium]QYK56012.1 MAG: NAD(P)/FAD-dependent oxidoreductase [Fimbriimonadaceae bacterium]